MKMNKAAWMGGYEHLLAELNGDSDKAKFFMQAFTDGSFSEVGDGSFILNGANGQVHATSPEFSVSLGRTPAMA